MEVDFLSAFGAGSGINTTEVVNSLVEAERAPLQADLDRMKEKADLKISAYGVVKSALNDLRSAFDKLNDVRDLKSFSVSNSKPDYLSFSAGAAVEAGSYDIAVTQLADRDSWVSGGFAASDTQINAGSGITLTLTTSSGVKTVSVTGPTPQAIVDAVNDAEQGYTAKLVDTGAASDPYVIVFEGDTGADNAFTITATDSTTGNPATGFSIASQVRTAADASLSLNGVAVTRSSNTITDLVNGATIRLNQIFSGSAAINVTADTSQAKTALMDLVSTYNSTFELFRQLSSNETSDDELVGSLSTDTNFRSIMTSIRRVVTSESSTGTGSMTHLSSMGLSMTREGTLAIDETRLDSALSSSFDDLVTALTAGTNDQTPFGDASRGIAGDASALIQNFLKSTGSVSQSIVNAENRQSEYETRLAELEARMERVKERYVAQFSAMESIVSQMKSTGDYLTNQFKAMNASD